MIKKLFIYVVLLLLPLALQAQVLEQNLGEGKWQFKQKTTAKWHKASVPGTVHTDLFKNKMIPDPFFADNEKQIQWIENEDWEYKTTFDVSNEELLRSHIELQFDGLDTYANVYVNDSLVLTADNMFRSWNVDVKKYVHKGKNELYVVFESAVKKGKAEAKKLFYTLPGDEKVFSRKAQYQYGWDWGPRLVTCGIWKNVKLVVWNDARILNVQYIQKSLTDSAAQLEFICEIKSDVAANAYLDIVSTKDLSGQMTNKIKLEKGIHTYALTYAIKDPQRWWCNGLGFPTLYNFMISLSYDSRFLDIKSIDIGLRTLELVQEKDTAGVSFYFKLNGRAVFMKGANYIPQDNFLPNVHSGDYKNIVKNAVDANMNMLRVWGGGVYGDNELYEQCDKQGILIWQDLMFACAMYPGDAHFTENVAAEITDQAKRLRNHPSLALWCGNNEVDEGWKNWGWQKQYNYAAKDSAEIENNYLQLFEHTIKDVLIANDPQCSYWPSSPSIGWGHKESLQQGDAHYWGVWWGNEPFEIYKEKVGRFMSEYGFQGMPEVSTFEKIADEKDLNFNSAAVKNHQKHPTGYQTIQTYLERDYKTPNSFENNIYVSQLLQAEGLKTAIEAHRRAKPYCMGTLYWQLNDCWPVTSWSSVDYYNNWKAAHYQAKKSYAPVLLSVNEEQDAYKIYIVNDETDTLNRVLYFKLIDFYGNELWSKAQAVRVVPNSSAVYYSIDKKEIGTIDPKQTVLSVQLLIPNVSAESSTLFYFVKPKELQLQKTKIKILKSSCQDVQCIALESDVLAKDVYIQLPGEPLNLSDNFFDLLPGEVRTIHLPAHKKIRHLEKKIKIKSLVDTY